MFVSLSKKKSTIACKTYVACKIQRFLTNLIPLVVLQDDREPSYWVRCLVRIGKPTKMRSNVQGSVHRDATWEKFENVALFLRLGPPSTQSFSKTLLKLE